MSDVLNRARNILSQNDEKPLSIEQLNEMVKSAMDTDPIFNLIFVRLTEIINAQNNLHQRIVELENIAKQVIGNFNSINSAIQILNSTVSQNCKDIEIAKGVDEEDLKWNH